ncbi:hypothetical protein [Yonghaparkia sp. Soil809]|uniref:hypothetical protein n=1 Tax=Yonghaparkia sp. Soil809 TaxID=1736417 RepID=UPI0006F79B84|nr:hypothetical protein [Yonghaparkia sp. Soil809]KRF31073.1 hypothetical protein ASG83_09640 [Yonghaparkia sp. Soil809]
MSETRRALLEQLADDLQAAHPRGRALVAIDGVDGAGKTTFADAWAAVLRERGVHVLRATLDDFLRPRAERHARGRDSAEGYYRDSIDVAALRAALVEPFRSGAESVALGVFDHGHDAPLEVRERGIPDHAVLLIDGIFLHQPELRGLWNRSIWLDVPPEVRDARLLARDGDGSRAARYSEGQYLYQTEANPRRAATIVIDNSDAANPRQVFDDFC